MWEHFSAYHIDRLEAVAAAFAGRYRVVAIEVATGSRMYAWPPVADTGRFVRHVLLPGGLAEDLPWRRKLVGLMRVVHRYRPAAVFLCNQEQPEMLCALPLLRLSGHRVFAMMDAKFDDSERLAPREARKRQVFRFYNGALVAGARHQAYYRFLGLPAGWSVPGYDTVSIDRVRAESGSPAAPAGLPFAERDFVVVGRFVAKKNIDVAIRAYAAYRRDNPGSARRLILCGGGPLEDTLRALVADLALTGVVFTGFLDSRGVAATLARGLALLVPSTGEQWGLVVNEAVAMGLPVIASDNVGARDTLVRSGVNGFIVEPHNHAGLAVLMGLLASNEALWRNMALGSQALAPAGDVQAFVAGVQHLVERQPAALAEQSAMQHNVTLGKLA